MTPGIPELPGLSEPRQVRAELADAQSTAEVLTAEASLLVTSESASSLSLGESIMEGTIADLLQAPAPKLEQAPSRQQSTAHAAIQAQLADAPVRASGQQTGPASPVQDWAAQVCQFRFSQRQQLCQGYCRSHTVKHASRNL